MESWAEFKLSGFGWFARLSPSVVLVWPQKLEGGDTGANYAPTLSWLHHYRYRPNKRGFRASIERFLQPSLGLHVVLLKFNNEDGVGLGGTLSLWRDFLSFGAGWNFSASSKDEGQRYCFIGSNLIGLVQTMRPGQS